MLLVFPTDKIGSLLSEARVKVSNGRTDLAFKVFRSWVISARVSELQNHGLALLLFGFMFWDTVSLQPRLSLDPGLP